jgi:hypothetical protein
MGNDMNSIRIAIAALFAVGALLGGGAQALHSATAHGTAEAASPGGMPTLCCGD